MWTSHIEDLLNVKYLAFVIFVLGKEIKCQSVTGFGRQEMKECLEFLRFNEISVWLSDYIQMITDGGFVRDASGLSLHNPTHG